MELKPLFFTLALTIAVCAALKKAHNVPQPYEENLAKIADKYAKPPIPQIPKTIPKTIPLSKRSLSMRSGRNKTLFNDR